MTQSSRKHSSIRPMHRAAAREHYWAKWTCDQSKRRDRLPIGPTDEHGLMPRKVRRAIALQLARKNWRTVRV